MKMLTYRITQVLAQKYGEPLTTGSESHVAAYELVFGSQLQQSWMDRCSLFYANNGECAFALILDEENDLWIYGRPVNGKYFSDKIIPHIASSDFFDRVSELP